MKCEKCGKEMEFFNTNHSNAMEGFLKCDCGQKITTPIRILLQTNYVIDFEKVKTVDDIKRILKAMNMTICNPKESNLEDLVKEVNS